MQTHKNTPSGSLANFRQLSSCLGILRVVCLRQYFKRRERPLENIQKIELNSRLQLVNVKEFFILINNNAYGVSPPLNTPTIVKPICLLNGSPHLDKVGMA